MARRVALLIIAFCGICYAQDELTSFDDTGLQVLNQEIQNIHREIATPTTDVTFSDDSKGIILKDRATGTLYRLYVSGGTLQIEEA